MRKDFQETISKARKNLRELQGEIISIEYFSKQVLRIDFDSEFSHNVIAMFNVSEVPDFKGQKTIIIDAEKGVYLSNKSTKKLINDFVRKSIFDFEQIRLLIKENKITSSIPLALGEWLYMPLTGAVRQSSDWIALHWLDQQREKLGSAIFETIIDIKMDFNLNNRNLNIRLHDVCYLGELSQNIIRAMNHSLGYELIVGKRYGLLDQFENCGCDNHSRLPLDDGEVKILLQNFQGWTLRRIHDHPELELPKFSRDVQLQEWKQYLYSSKIL